MNLESLAPIVDWLQTATQHELVILAVLCVIALRGVYEVSAWLFWGVKELVLYMLQDNANFALRRRLIVADKVRQKRRMLRRRSPDAYLGCIHPTLCRSDGIILQATPAHVK